MKSKYVITLFNSKLNEYKSTHQEFLTFEEAAILANRVRHELGMDWKTVSIIDTTKDSKNAFTTKKD